ncbi:hypothetical protein P3342_005411 [Pyrenophora teres f. teres]|nr:hypothetical protein P3342_005411 [Pyrenophora teres f. teres]
MTSTQSQQSQNSTCVSLHRHVDIARWHFETSHLLQRFTKDLMRSRGTSQIQGSSVLASWLFSSSNSGDDKEPAFCLTCRCETTGVGISLAMGELIFITRHCGIQTFLLDIGEASIGLMILVYMNVLTKG